ncbi:MAG: type II secretion system F family protein [Syntrophobacterales bacterium]|nr:type II secretion system F family protein [Syntrophobacterales bacterium]
MAVTPRDLWYALGLAALFVAVLFLLSAVYVLVWEPLRQRRKVAKRLEESSDAYMRRVQLIKARQEDQTSPGLNLMRLMLGKDRLLRLQRQMLQADVYRSPAEFLGLVALLFFSGLLLGAVFLKSLLFGLLLGLFLAFLPVFWLRQKRKHKATKVEAQLPDAMEILARSLRAGHTLPSAVELLGQEMDHPLGTEFRIAYEEQRFGLSMTEALENILERVDIRDLKYFVTAVLIQTDTGGNLAEIVEKIAHLIRARLNFKLKIRSLTAEGRLSAIVLSVLPIFVFLGMTLIKYEYEMALFFEPVGRVMLLLALILLITGSWIMHRLIQAVEV